MQVDCCYYLNSNWIQPDVPLRGRNKAIEICLQTRMPRLHKEKDAVLLFKASAVAHVPKVASHHESLTLGVH